jgi:glycogen debranching enzyme
MPDTEKRDTEKRPELRPRTRSLPGLTAPVDPARFVEVTGERIALLGREDGPFECWLWPIKVLSDLRFGLWRPSGNESGEEVALPEREITILPGELFTVWKGPGVQLRTEIFACRERPGLALGFALDSDEPLELEVSFRCDFRPMWPAGLGGQLVRVDEVTGAFALSEELGRWAVLIGASGARVVFDESDHALPAGPVRIRIPLEAGGSSTVLAIAGAEVQPDPLSDGARRGEGQAATGFARAARAIAATRELWFRLVSDFSAEREAVHVHWRAHAARVLAIETPYPALDEAFRWSEIAIERAWVRVDGLGRGLVAGLGLSGGGERPGYGWFFDGDALAASRALTAAGDFVATRDVLRFAAAHQRADGKLMHELTLSAKLCRWLEDYPYAYYKGMNSADFVAALDLYVRWSGDLDLARELLPAARRALEWCERALDGEGRLSNALAGIAAVEAGPLADKIECEVFLQGAWIAALGAGARLVQAASEDPAAAVAEVAAIRALEERARAGFESFWSAEHGHYGFALLRGGQRCDDLTAYLGYPLSRGLGERARAWASVQALNRPEVMSDWGARMFARDSKVYDPKNYNQGAVFPYLTNFVSLALFAHGHAFAAHQVLFSQVALCHFGGLGFLEEHLEGERASIPHRGVPHQIFSSAALVESVLLGLFGIEATASEKRITFRPTLPPHWDEARLTGLRVGATSLDVRLYRRREQGATVLGIELERGEGPGLELGFAPVCPPLTRLVDGPGWLRPSGAVVPRRLHRSSGEPLTLEARVLEGPAVLLPSALPERGETSKAVRLVAQRQEGERLTWTFAAPPGTCAALPFFCDFDVVVTGAHLVDGELRLDFPSAAAGTDETWPRCEVGVRAK